MKERINVTRPSMPPFEEYAEEIKSIWESGMMTNFGPLEGKLREDLRAFLDVPELLLYVNGHQALIAAVDLIAGGHKGGKIITTPFTFASTTEAIVAAGFTPVFADVDPVTYTLSPAAVEELIDSDTAAIVPVHVYGTLCDTEGFDRLSEKYGIPVIYDAAHCFGVKKDGIGAGNYGSASMFSFHATKAFNTIEGGAVAVKDPVLAEKLRRYANYGLNAEGDPDIPGSNSKMNEFAAAMGICNLRRIGEVLKKREVICKAYTEALTRGRSCDKATGAIAGLNIKLLPEQQGVERNFAYFPVVFGTLSDDGTGICGDGGRTVLQVTEKLGEENIFPRRYFYPLTSEFKCMERFDKGLTPVAKALSGNVLSLPLYADMDPAVCGTVADIILSCV